MEHAIAVTVLKILHVITQFSILVFFVTEPLMR